jgi:hypothetical protein
LQRKGFCGIVIVGKGGEGWDRDEARKSLTSILPTDHHTKRTLIMASKPKKKKKMKK